MNRAPLEWDNAVESTSDDAAISKLSAANLGYYTDKYLHHFVTRRKAIRRSPIINRGYFARVAIRDKIVSDFLTVKNGNFSKRQIVSLGSGSDSLYFRLKSSTFLDSFSLGPSSEGAQPKSAELLSKNLWKFIEVDFPAVISRKAKIIHETEELNSLLTNAEFNPKNGMSKSSGIVVKSKDFYMLSADIIKTDALIDLLNTVEEFDVTFPTLFLSECVLVYLDPTESMRIIKTIGEKFSDACFFVYEQIRPNDAFGRVMKDNLIKRGCPLKGLENGDQESCADQINRFTVKAGWKECECLDMNDIYYKVLDKAKNFVAERLELFDEFEEWHLMSAHYCIVLSKQFIEGKGFCRTMKLE